MYDNHLLSEKKTEWWLKQWWMMATPLTLMDLTIGGLFGAKFLDKKI